VKRTPKFNLLVSVAVIFLSIACRRSDPTDEKPVLRTDLSQFGFSTGSTDLAASYSSLVFLSNDYLLVVINERHWIRSVEQSNTDLPLSRFLLINTKTNSVVRSTFMRAEKELGSVQGSESDRFVIWDESGLELCEAKLTCTQHSVLSGPMIVSPQGTTIAVGGWGWSDQHLLDGASLRELAKYRWNNPALVPGDGVVLLRYEGHKFSIKEGNAPEIAVPLVEAVPNEIRFPESRFLSHSAIAANETVGSIVVTDLSARPIHRFGVSESLRDIDIVSCACQNKFAIREERYSPSNSLANFLDIEHTRPYDVEELRVIDVLTGAVEFSLTRDPRPYLPRLPVPVFSPDGHRIALVYRGFLEVYELP
jgi:hypothetical protein